MSLDLFTLLTEYNIRDFHTALIFLGAMKSSEYNGVD
jgi:hypothetical protein